MNNGMLSFVLRSGIFRFGIPIGLVLCLPVILNPHPTIFPIYLTFPIAAVVSGTFYGIAMWYVLRRKYNLPSK